MNCSEFDGLLDDYMDGNLPPEQRKAFESHFRECQTCSRLLEELLTTMNRLRAEVSPMAPKDAGLSQYSKQSLEENIIAK